MNFLVNFLEGIVYLILLAASAVSSLGMIVVAVLIIWFVCAVF